MSKLSVIIPTLNEGELLAATIKSIRETSGSFVPIIVVDDNSDDYSAKVAAQKYDARYFRNETRLGVAGSRDKGVNLSDTEFNLIIDAHMKFYNDDWENKMINAIERYPRSLFCTKCEILGDRRKGSNACKGAHIIFRKGRHLLSPKWNRKKLEKEIEEIPCVLGASYLVSSEYYKRLKGLNGLKTYGMDETFLSLKVLLEGGMCRLLNSVSIAHKFRETPPFELIAEDFVYNKGYIIKVLFPENMLDSYLKSLAYFKKSYPKAMDGLKAKETEIQEMREYFLGIKSRTFENVMRFNNRFRTPFRTFWAEKMNYRFMKGFFNRVRSRFAGLFVKMSDV